MKFEKMLNTAAELCVSRLSNVSASRGLVTLGNIHWQCKIRKNDKQAEGVDELQDYLSACQGSPCVMVQVALACLV